MRFLPLLALLACKSPPEVPVADGSALVVTSVPDPLAPCGDATIGVTLGGPLPGVQSVSWVLGDAFGNSPLDGSGAERTFDLPAQALTDSCSLPTCQIPLQVTVEAGVATFTTEVDVVVLTDVDPSITLDGDDPADLEPVLYVDDQALEAELELVATAPEQLTVTGKACVTGAPEDDCITTLLTYDGGGDWVVDASALASCRAGDLKADWELSVEVGVEHCDAPLSVHPVPLRFLTDDCDADGTPARDAGTGDCDDLDPDAAASEGATVYPDGDADGHGLEGSAGTYLCPQDPPPVGTVALDNADCDDTDPFIFPLAPDDQCDGVDDNCVGGPDDEAPGVTLYPDDDGDTWGFNDGLFSMGATICELPVDGWGPASDCDEDGPNAADINPGVAEDPLTPWDDNCDLVGACGVDCEQDSELLLAAADGLVAVEDPFGLPPTFSTVRSWTETPVDVGFADLDGNGYLDALVQTDTSLRIEWDLALAGSSEVLAAVGGGSITVGDFDQDGTQDALVGTTGLATVYWGGPGTPVSTDLDGGEQTGMADLDLDGCPDLIVVDSEDAGSYDTVSHVYFGTPDGNGACERTFETLAIPTSGPAGFAVGQLDGIGGPELVFAEQRSGSVASPVPTTSTTVVVFSGRLTIEAEIAVPAPYAASISTDARLAFAHEPNAADEGVSTWEHDGSSYTMLAELPGLDVVELLWFPFDGPDDEDLVVLTDGAGGFDRLFFDGDPANEELLGFDVPTSAARVVSFADASGYRTVLVTGRHPDGTGTDHTRFYLFNGQNPPAELLLTEESAIRPFLAFTPSQFPAPFPRQDEPL